MLEKFKKNVLVDNGKKVEDQVKLINCYLKQRFQALLFSVMEMCPILGKIFPLTLIYF